MKYLTSEWENKIKEALQRESSIKKAAFSLQIPFTTLLRISKKIGFKPKKIHSKNARSISLKEILEGRHPLYKSDKLKERLIKTGIKSEICEECGIENIWHGKKLIFHLDHVDGNRYNQRLDNLRMLCPNCHSQTETYCGKNHNKKVIKIDFMILDQDILKKINNEFKCECGKVFVGPTELCSHFVYCQIHRNGEKRIYDIPRNQRAVIQLTVYGNIIREYKSIKEASELTKTPKSTICCAIKKERLVNGFIWKYKII